jgi:hypothetical protein
MLPSPGNRSIHVFEGCAHTPACSDELDHRGADTRCLGCRTETWCCICSVNREKICLGVKRRLVHRLRLASLTEGDFSGRSLPDDQRARGELFYLPEQYIYTDASALMVLCIDGSSSHLAPAFNRPIAHPVRPPPTVCGT